MRRLLVLLAVMPIAAWADQVLEGDTIRIHYDSLGVWNDGDAEAGFQVWHDDAWVDYAYAGYPFQMWRLGYTDADGSQEYYALSYNWQSNATVIDESDLSTSDNLIASYTYEAGDITMTKTETWAVDGSVVLVHFLITNDGSEDLSDVRLLWSIDPDIDSSSTYNTNNDTLDADGDGTDDYAQSVGPSTGYTLALGACDPANSELGHYSGWQSSRDVDVALSDSNGTSGDIAMGIRITLPEDVAAGRTVEASFLAVVGDTAETAEDLWLASGDMCRVCDEDGDGFLHADCGGSDCDDADADTYPGAPDALYDGIDSDCAGDSDFDGDGDGYDSDAYGGEDCDDEDPDINPDAEDVPYDGDDTDCSGGSDYDADGDGFDSAGHGGDDCNDSDASISPGAEEVWYDGVDSNCDGQSDYDADGDGHDSAEHGGDDCDDFNSAAYPGAPEIANDSVDQDCDGADATEDDEGNGNDGDPIDLEKGGCSCSTPAAGAPWLALLLVPLAARRRRRG